jgi:hypothetical protein
VFHAVIQAAQFLPNEGRSFGHSQPKNHHVR